MSRIHEALKKAQEARAAQQASSEANTAPPTEGQPALTGAPAIALAAPPMMAPGRVPERASCPLTFDILLGKGRQERWNPDPKALLFLNGDNNILGKEVFRTLRTRLYQIRGVQPLNTILVTSALASEGKTFVVSNLGQSIIRQRERRALLIDADLRLSRLHAPFGAPPTPGLAEYLLGEADELAILQRGTEDNLFLISGGRAVPNPIELLGNGRLKTLLERMRPLFDWIIIDSPPTLPVSDSNLLANYCDAVLMVIRSGVTPLPAAQKACQQFQDRHLIGTVLNRAETSSGYESYDYEGYTSRTKLGKSRD